MSDEFITYPDREMLSISLADRIAGQLGQHLRTHDHATLCVPGGTSPVQLFETLSGADLDWDRVTVVLGDERWVPGDHKRSNARLLRRHLLKDKAATARLVGLYDDSASPDLAAPTLAGMVEAMLPLTVTLLGMGNDMHTASLFPGADGLDAALADNAPAVMAIHGGGADEPRITLTARALRDSICGHLMIFGPEKRAAFEQARELAQTEAPIRALMGNLTVHWAE